MLWWLRCGGWTFQTLLHPFKEFITATVKDRICNGSIIVVGHVGEVEPPHLVMPITVEPSKLHMCNEKRFINCWIKDCPFKLDYLMGLYRYVDPGHCQTTFDDKSGYSHICVHPRSFTFFAFQWEGWYFTYACLPFGWKASAFVHMPDSYVYILGLMACALCPTFSWVKWRLSSPVSLVFPSGTSLASRKVVWHLRRLGASWAIFATLRASSYDPGWPGWPGFRDLGTPLNPL